MCDVGSLVIGTSYSHVLFVSLIPGTLNRDVLSGARTVPTDRLMVHSSAEEDLPRDQIPTRTDEDERRAGYVIHLRRLNGVIGSLRSHEK